MLKTIKVTFKIDDESKKDIIKTFNKISQKFGHINIDSQLCDLNLVIELINITKRYNNKITINTDALLLNELILKEESKILYLFENVDILGLNINTPIFNIDLYQIIIHQAMHYNCTININTVLTNEFVNLDLSEQLKTLSYNNWYIYTNNEEDYNTFINKNKAENMIHKDDYYYVLPNGQFVNHDEKVISSINKPSNEIYRDLIKYNPNLKNQINNIQFNYFVDKYYLEKVTKKVNSGKAIFFDIEAVSRESTNSQKHHLKDYPIPILYALLKIDLKTLKVVDRSSFSVTNVTDLHTIYYAFLNYVKENDIEYIVVSNGDLEKRFIDNCIIYIKSKLKLDDYRYLFKLRDNLIDIQKILDKQMNSYKLLKELSINYPDLITFTRKTTKLSFKINFLLDGLIFGPKHHEKEIQKIIEYCFEDCFADFELFKFYDFISNHNLI
ncbi:MAG: hypothetical protein K0Q49_1622 [Haloplasmataceae bacterium]|jgi:hypothetical protein|nr:hypothetical protein [Haloplasmataceae bacterium]